MNRIKTIFAYVCLLCVLGLASYGLEARRSEGSSNEYRSPTDAGLGIGSSALAGAGMGLVLGLIAGWTVGSSALSTSARRGMMVGLIAGLILGAYNEYNKPEAGGPTMINED